METFAILAYLDYSELLFYQDGAKSRRKTYVCLIVVSSAVADRST